MDANRRLVQSGHRADFPCREIGIVTEHEDRALSSVELIDCRCQAGTPLAGQQPLLGIGRCRPSEGPLRIAKTDIVGLDEPTIATCSSLAAVEAAVDENPREPHLERPRLPVGGNVAEGLDERILHGLVGFGAVAQVLERNPRGPPLVRGDQLRELLARLVAGAPLDQVANLDCEPRIVRDVGANPGAGGRGGLRVSQTNRTRFTHRITYAASQAFTVYPVPASV